MSDTQINPPLIIGIGKKQFIAGMRWQYLPLRGKRHLRLRAKAENITHWISCPAFHNTTTGSLLGTCRLEPSATPLRQRYCYSLALLVMPHMAVNSYAVFPLTDKLFWFIARYHGDLSPFSDVIGDLEDITRYVQRFLQLLPGEQPWVVYAPDGVFPCPTQPLPDYERLSAENPAEWRKIRLTACDNRATLRRSGLFLCLLAATIGGHACWRQYQAQKNIAAAQRYLQEQQALQAGKLAKTMPWEKMPAFREVVEQCQQQWGQLPLLIAGWQFSEARCEANGGMTVRYLLKQPGNIRDFSHRVDEHFLTPIKVTFNIPGAANDATFFLPLKWHTPTTLSTEERRDMSVRDLVAYAQKMNLALRLAPEETDSRTDRRDVWQRRRFSLVSAFPPQMLFTDPLFTRENIRADSMAIENNDRKLSYRLDGVLYVAR